MTVMKQTTEIVKLANHVVFVVILFAFVVCPLEGRVCTRVRSEVQVKTVTYLGQCVQAFEDNCHWFSSEKCVFNETVACVKTRNVTSTRYRIVEDCCPGYLRNRDGRCVRGGAKGPHREGGKHDDHLPHSGGKHPDPSDSVQDVGVDSEASHDRSSGDNDDDDDDDNFFLGISHGAYAGIICGILFVACVALLTAIHYRKRRLQDEKKASAAAAAEQDAAQRQQMIPMEKMESPDAVAT